VETGKEEREKKESREGSEESMEVVDPFKAVVRVPLEDTEYPCYTCLW
jgi:hypothetical protein